MFKNLKETTHNVKHEVTVKFDDPSTKMFLKTIGVIVVINGAAHIVNTLVAHKLNSI